MCVNYTSYVTNIYVSAEKLHLPTKKLDVSSQKYTGYTLLNTELPN